MVEEACSAVAFACSALRRDGLPCRAMASSDGLCFAHSPALKGKAEEARRRGGKGKARAARLGRLVPRRLQGIYDLLEEALGEVHSGALTPTQGTAMAALAGAMVRVLTSGELEERVRRLEERGQASTNGGGAW